MGASESSHQRPKVRDFNALLGAVTDAASVDVIDGLDFQFIQPVSKLNGFLVHSLKISPRVYPVEMSTQVGEPVRPGSFNSIFITDILDMTLRVTLGLSGNGSADLTVPISPDIKTNLTTQLDLSAIQGYFQISKPKFNCEAAFSSTNYFSKADITSDFTFQLTKNLTVGALFQTSLFEKRKIARVGYLRHFGKFESGLILSYDGNLRLNKSLTYRANERTVGYLQYDFAVSELIGLTAIGFERNFMMTAFAANFNTLGVISSKIERKMRNNRKITLTSIANVFERVYRFGLGLSYN